MFEGSVAMGSPFLVRPPAELILSLQQDPGTNCHLRFQDPFRGHLPPPLVLFIS